MVVKKSMYPDEKTYPLILRACSCLFDVDYGKMVHGQLAKLGFDSFEVVNDALLEFYRGFGKIFENLTNKTVVSWSSMIKGYINHDQNLDALSLFSRMKTDGVKADFVTVINILPACVNIGALEQVKCLHGYSMKFGLNLLSSVNSALLISYAKCGCIDMARKLFDEEEIDGLVREGRAFFKEMREIYGCQPSQEHYACIVDLLGRAGHINEARELVREMPFKPDTRVWGPLLSACRLHSESKFAEFAAEKLLTMEPRNAGNYVLLSNIYAAAGKWDKFAEMRRLLKDKGLKKIPGCSWLQINGHLHEFRVADRSHPKVNDIYALLAILEFSIKEAKSHSRQMHILVTGEFAQDF
ncbi:hypothetical protein COLO4_31029 [Corchorus olitorius]|uniref:Pentatricopeptide repeat-containing protein n=1 Tax=Corchorus olitorius TaxID=93759 RepID=A0A1R3H6B2_9ROSI|nr:hypothetical protein COLO4_31029 [Corchorus olitorius]